MLYYIAMMKTYPKKYGDVVKVGNYMSATMVEYIQGMGVVKAFNLVGKCVSFSQLKLLRRILQMTILANLEELRNVDVRTVRREDLVDIRDVQINMDLPQENGELLNGSAHLNIVNALKQNQSL